MKRAKTIQTVLAGAVLGLFLNTAAFSQIIHPTSGVMTLEACEDFQDGDAYYDSGGANGSYSNNENGMLELCGDCGQTVTVNFMALDVETGFHETCWDFIKVIGSMEGKDGNYGGDDSDFGSNPDPTVVPRCLDLTDNNGNTMSGGGSSSSTGGQVYSSSFSSMEGGCIAFQFISDNAVPQTGWYAIVNVSSCETVIPVGGPVACNNLVQVSLDQQCQAEITPDMILEGSYPCYENFSVQIEGINGVVVETPGTYVVTIMDMISGNYCWSNILVEDNIPPTVTCPCEGGVNLELVTGISGELTADDPIFSAEGQDCWEMTTLIDDTHEYDVFTFYVEKSDEYTFELSGDIQDAMAAIFEGDFDPTDCSNFVAGDDDGGNGLDPLIITALMGPGTYTLVTTNTTFGNPLGTYDWAFSSEMSCDIFAMQACEVTCIEAQHLYNSTDLTGELGWNPVPSDNCSDPELNYSDHLTDGATCENSTITRTWTATYTAHGEQITEVVCVQTFIITPATIDEVLLPPGDVTVSCGTGTDPADIAAYYDTDGRGYNPYSCAFTTASNGAITPNNDGFHYAYPTVEGSCGEYIPINPTICNIGATYTDQYIPACAGNKVIRLWQILDWCNPDNGTTPHAQIIKVIDNEDPYIDIVVNDDVEITEAADPWGCDKVLTLPHPEHVADNCGSVNYWVEIPGITNDPFNLPFSETKTFGNPHYFPADMIDQDEEGRYVIVNAPKGTHIVTYYAEDDCENISSDQIVVNIVDETPPVAIAKQNIVVSLTSGSTDDAGIAKLYVNSVDNGSHDGCSDDLFMEIRREDENTCWNNTFRYVGFPYNSAPYATSLAADPDAGQYVKFCCDDLGDEGYGLITVVLRVWDDGDCDGIPGELGEDNYNDTWVTVRVEDKLPPTIQCPPDVTIDCDEDYLDMNLTGTATAFTTCGDEVPNFSDRVDLDACGAGIVTRTWSVVTAGGAASCIQKIYVEALNPFQYSDITWPVDMDLDCLEYDAGEPSWNTVPCSLVGSSLEQQVFEFESGACFKELNHWTVIDWCTYDPIRETGIWTKTQIIKVFDTDKPEIECTNQLAWATEDCLAQDVELTNRATDEGNCPSPWLKWEVCLDINYDWSCDHIWTSDLGTAGNPNDNIYYLPASAGGDDVDLPVPSSVVSSNPGQPSELDLPLGEHRIVWTVHDGCGNVSTCTEILTVEDKKAPTPYCIQNLSTATMEHGGFVDIWAIDFNLDSYDNCTGKDDLRYTFTDTHPDLDPNYDDVLRSSYQRFTCPELGEDKSETFTLSMYVWDEYDNKDHCFVQLRVDDHHGDICDGTSPRASISGVLVTEIGDLVDQTNVQLNATLPEFPIEQMTDGEYAFMDNPMYVNYEVSAEKNDDYHNGVSTIDMVIIQQHILGLELLNSPYKVIAADINSDEKVSAIDLLDLRKLILGVIDEFPNNDSWRFVDASQEFANVNNPWPFIETLAIHQLSHDMMTEDFIATKIGDVSGDAEANLTSGVSEIRTNATLNLMTEERSFASGDQIKIDITSEEFNDVYGYQFTLNYTGLEFVGVEAGSLDITTDNFGLHKANDGMISTSWASSKAVSSNEVLFSIHFIATANGVLSESLSVGSAITTAEAYRGTSLSVENVSLEFRTENGSLSASEYILHQNEPNPFAAATVIGFELPTASEAIISVFDVTGKLIKVVKGDFAKGYNEVSLQRNELNSAGVLYYQLESGSYTATKKMILID